MKKHLQPVLCDACNKPLYSDHRFKIEQQQVKHFDCADPTNGPAKEGKIIKIATSKY